MLLLVIDDEESVRYAFQQVFGEDAEVVTAATAREGIELVQSRSPDVVVLDLQLPDGNGMEVFEVIRRDDPKRPVVFITAHGSTETAIEAMKRGAFDYLLKPLDLDRLTQILNRAFEAARLMHVPALLEAEETADRIVGRSAVIQEMSKAIGRVAPQDVNVLILGESGTGKELVARALYHHSRRASKPFLAINCAAIPENLLESELFGHEQGAFTGAARRRIGKFEQCDGGTLFLDEIGDMAPALQAKMLRLLQDQQFERVGGNETLHTNVRILTATNQDLEKLVNEGRFRKDLYYRLRGVTIRVPPLRERPYDIGELAHYFLFRFNRELSTDYRGLDPALLKLFENSVWPGNVRELQGTLRQAMLQGAGHILMPEFLPSDFPLPAGAAAVADIAAPASDSQGESVADVVEGLLTQGALNLHARTLEAVERVLIPRVLKHTQGHQAHAAEILGLSRGTLRQKLKNLGFSIDKVFVEEDQPEE